MRNVLYIDFNKYMFSLDAITGNLIRLLPVFTTLALIKMYLVHTKVPKGYFLASNIEIIK